jgi:hypothetical protein
VGRRGPVELADLFDAFDASVTYDKLSHSLELAATVTAERVPAAETLRPARRRSQNSDIAGAGCGQTSATAYRLVELRQL